MDNNNFFNNPAFAVLTVVLLSMAFGMSAMSGLESCVSPGGVSGHGGDHAACSHVHVDSFPGAARLDEREKLDDKRRKMMDQRSRMMEESRHFREETKKYQEKARKLSRMLPRGFRGKGTGHGSHADPDGQWHSEESMSQLSAEIDNAVRNIEEAVTELEMLNIRELPLVESLSASPHTRNIPGGVEVRVGKFDRIMGSDCIDIEYAEGHYDGTIEVCASGSDLPGVAADVYDGCLSLRFNGNRNEGSHKVIVRITAPVLREVTLYGASTFTAAGVFNIRDTFEIYGYGASEASFGEICGGSMTIGAYSAGKVYALAVDVDTLNVNACSASRVRLKGMNAGMVSADAHSAAQIVLGGRCGALLVTESALGMVNARGVIVEPDFRRRDGTEMPRSPFGG